MRSRREFIAAALTAGLGSALAACVPKGRAPRIVLRSSWQTVNIGDIAHTPGVLALLEGHLPEAEITLWPSNVENGVADLLRRRFPRLRIVSPKPDVAKIYAEHDFLLHGSGPSLVGESQVVQWRQQGPKPYGVLGITQGPPGPRTVEVLNGAQFVYFRDSVSLETARAGGVKCPVMEFGPDGAFATDLRDEGRAEEFLEANGLEPGRFLCCIPRYRMTPYWRVKPGVKFDPVRQLRNDEKKESDHAQLREAIVQVVNRTGHKVLICPEDRTQMLLGKEILFDRLPYDVRARVVWRPDYWLTDEALSVYVRSLGLFGNEMHSPIMCIGQGIPAIVCRWSEQTTKGYMWSDIGLGEWLFDFDREEDVMRLPETVLAMAKDPDKARRVAAKGRAFVEQRQRETMALVKKEVG